MATISPQHGPAGQPHPDLARGQDEALARITTTTDYAAFGDADLVIEAATEKEEVKRAIFKLLTPH